MKRQLKYAVNQKSHPAIGAAFLIYFYDIPGSKLRFLRAKKAQFAPMMGIEFYTAYRAQKTGQACALSSFL